MIELGGNEPLLTLSQATRLKWLPRLRRGRPITFSAFYRWAVFGVGGAKLSTVSIGATMFTNENAVKEFFRARGARPIRTRSPRRNPGYELPPDRSPLRGPAAAEAEAERIGL